MARDIAPDPPPCCIAAFIAITCRDPHFDPEDAAYEEGIEWLVREGYVEVTASSGPIVTGFGRAYYMFMGLAEGWPKLSGVG